MDARGHFGCCVGTFPDLELGRFQVEMCMICYAWSGSVGGRLGFVNQASV